MAEEKLMAIRGDTVEYDFAARRKDNSIINLTDAEEIKFTIRPSVAGGALITKRLNVGVEVENAELGLFTVTLFPPDTQLFGDYKILVYDAEVTDVDGTVVTVQHGYITVIGDVSRG